jgi:hypothetical protein
LAAFGARDASCYNTSGAHPYPNTKGAASGRAFDFSLYFRIANWTGSLDTFGNFISSLQSAAWEKFRDLGGLTRFLENVGGMAQSEKLPEMGR